jgi:hypothetical protein
LRATTGRTALKRKRIVVVGGPEILRELLVRTLEAEPDMAVVPRHGPDVDAIVLAVPGEVPDGTVLELLAPRPGPRVLVLEHDARQWSLWTLRPHRTELGAPSLTDLVDVLRGGDVDPPMDPN